MLEKRFEPGQAAKAGRKEARKAAEALKERAVGLLEVYARSHAPNAALIAASLGPLLRAVQAGHVPGRVNPDRLRNVIAHRLLKCATTFLLEPPPLPLSCF